MNSLKIKSLMVFTILLSGMFCPDLSNAQTTCATAVSVTANGACIGSTTVNDNTINGNANVCGDVVSREIWYKFTCIGNSATIVASASNRDLAIELLSACGGTLIGCDNTTTGGGADTETLNVTGLTNGTTYIVRIVNVGNNDMTLTSLCITTTTAFDPCSSITNIAACGSTVNATIASGNGGYASSSCGFTTGGKELIYTFTPATSGNYSIQQLSSFAYIDYQFKAVSAGCNNTGYACIDDISGAGTSTGFSLTGGTQYYILLDPESTAGGNVSFVINCAAPTPANDNPCSATPVTVNSAFTCTTQTAGTIAGATASGNALGACFGTADDDVWFSFVANNSTQNISLNNITGSTSDLYFSVYSGACGSLGTALLCSDPESNTLTGLTVGNTYIIRVYSYTSTSGQTSTFSVCITPPPPVPANDNPCNATTVPVNSAFTCTTQTAGTIAGATASGNALGACFGTADDDVWFKFVANNSTQFINLNNITGSTSDLYFSVYSGACGSLGTALLCSDPESNTLTGLTVGNTYIIRVYSYTSTSGQTSTFSVCITPPPPVPANDNPCNATTVPVNSAAGTCTTQTAGTIAGATASGNALGACFGTADDDVWFKFVANSTSMNINLNNVTGSTTDLYHSVYSGACGSLGTALICSDPNSSTITGLTIGNTYIIRIYSYTSTSGQTTSFSVCINPTPPPPTNVTCAQMQPICSGSPIVFQAQSGGGSAASGPDYGCLSTTPNPTWFYLQISTPGTMAIDLTAGSDVDFALWGPYANLAAAQANCLTFPSPLDCSYSSSATEQMNISSVTTGQVYAVLVTNYASVVQSITLNQALGATATTNCSILPIELVSFKGDTNGPQNALEWVTASEKNNDYFTIEKSKDAVNFEQLAVVDGAGNSTGNLNYSTYDNAPYAITYYRLKQTDYDQSFKYSQIISIDRLKDEERISNVYPNPTKDNLNFDVFTKTKGKLLVDIINNKGEQVYAATQIVDEGNTTLNVPMDDLRNGVYLLKVTVEKTGKVLIYKVAKD